MSVDKDHAPLEPPALSPAPRIAIASALFNARIVSQLRAGAEAALARVGAEIEHIETPGALELPLAIRFAADSRRFDGFVALGCVIRGETTHYEIVSNESARGLMALGLDQNLAIGNGVLTVENVAQAEERADPARLDKGGEAAIACLHLIAIARRFRPASGPFGSGDEQILLA